MSSYYAAQCQPAVSNATEHVDAAPIAMHSPTSSQHTGASSGEKQIVATEHADDSVPYAQASDALPSFDIDARGWKIIHVPVAKHSYHIRCGDKIVHVPPQSQILTVAVNPARTMADEWTLGGVTFFVISPGDTDEFE